MIEGGIAAVDVFCGVGGLSQGLRDAGIRIVAGIDLDPACRYPFEQNIKAQFIEQDITTLTGADLTKLYPKQSIRLLAGCAPCTPFSSLRGGQDTTCETEWGLLSEFSRLVKESLPDLVTMENVARLGSQLVFEEFVSALEGLKYSVDWASVPCVKLGIPQTRRRLVLVASRIGAIGVPQGKLQPAEYRTVRQTIGGLPRLDAGDVDPHDTLHRARGLEEVNIERIRASVPGGTWNDWREELRAPCHRRNTGKSYRSVYARMEWDKPAPTITTQSYNFGTGRFGHPDQDRAITPREAAMLQTFPKDYVFTAPDVEPTLSVVGRLIGNAVPPMLGFHIGREMMEALGQ
jgi:DNA (cytosine-5)-methyltransferase 1